MKLLILILSLGLVACGSGGGSGSASSDDRSSPSVPSEAVTAVHSTGRDFSCLSFNLAEGGQVWCRIEGAPDARLGIPSPQFEKYIEITGGDIDDLETWDDTICFSAQVDSLPYNNGPGTATYCIGEASFGPAYSGYNIVYSPPFQASDLSAEVWTEELPFSGADLPMGHFTNDGAVYGIMQDSRIEVSATNVNCTLEGTTLTCAGFAQTLEVQ